MLNCISSVRFFPRRLLPLVLTGQRHKRSGVAMLLREIACYGTTAAGGRYIEFPMAPSLVVVKIPPLFLFLPPLVVDTGY